MTAAGASLPLGENRSTLRRVRDWIANPWGKPRFLVIVTWAYIAWSIAPVLIAIQFSFNDGRSLTAWHPPMIGTTRAL